MPSPVDRYFKEVKDSNPSYSDEKAWATAWSIYCKHKNPDSDHCHKSPGEYLKGKTARVAASYTPDELVMIAILWGIKPQARQKYLTRTNLGEYSPVNPVVKSLIDKGLVKVRNDGVIVVPDNKRLQAIMEQNEAPEKAHLLPNSGYKFKREAASMAERVVRRYRAEV